MAVIYDETLTDMHVDKLILVVSVSINVCCKRSCFVCPGTFAVVSIMVGSAVERLAPDSSFSVNGTNETSVDTDARDAYRVQIASAIAILTGLFQVCFCLCVYCGLIRNP